MSQGDLGCRGGVPGGFWGVPVVLGGLTPKVELLQGLPRDWGAAAIRERRLLQHGPGGTEPPQGQLAGSGGTQASGGGGGDTHTTPRHPDPTPGTPRDPGYVGPHVTRVSGGGGPSHLGVPVDFQLLRQLGDGGELLLGTPSPSDSQYNPVTPHWGQGDTPPPSAPGRAPPPSVPSAPSGARRAPPVPPSPPSEWPESPQSLPAPPPPPKWGQKSPSQSHQWARGVGPPP